MLNFLATYYTQRFSPGLILLFAVLFFGSLVHFFAHWHDDPNAAANAAILNHFESAKNAFKNQMGDRCERLSAGDEFVYRDYAIKCTGGREWVFGYLPPEKRSSAHVQSPW